MSYMFGHVYFFDYGITHKQPCQHSFAGKIFNVFLNGVTKNFELFVVLENIISYISYQQYIYTFLAAIHTHHIVIHAHHALRFLIHAVLLQSLEIIIANITSFISYL